MAKAKEKPIEISEEEEPIEGLETFTKDTPVSRMPPSPGSRVSDDKWFAFLENIPEDEWGHLIIYGYRWWPIIDKRIVDPSATTNIFKSVKPIDKDWLLKTWGTGSYNLKLNDTRKRKGQMVTECVVKFEEPYAEYPPVLDYGELVLDHRDNKGFVEWAIAHGKLESKGDKVMPSADMGAAQFLMDAGKRALEEGARVRPNTQPGDKGVDRAFDLMGKAYEKSIEVLAKPEKSPAAELSEVAKVLKDLGLGTGNSQGNLVEMILKLQTDNAKLLAEAQNKNIELLMKVMETQNKPHQQVSVAEQMESFAKVFEIMHGITDGMGKSGDWKSTAIEMVPNGIQAVSNLLHNIAVFKGIKPGQPIPPDQLISGELPPGVTAMPKEAALPPGALEMVNQLGMLVWDAINRNVSGTDWADSFIIMNGRAQYDMLCGLGKDQLIGGLQAIPQLWAKFEPVQPSLHKFLDEFMQVGPEMDKGEDEDGDE